jgi:hypothetical protein
MSKYSFGVEGWTPVPVADTVGMTANGYCAILGQANMRCKMHEVYMGGLAGVNSPMLMVLSRDTVVGASLTALAAGATNTQTDPSASALASPPQAFTAATTNPQRSATAHILNLTFNAWGGIVRWVSSPDEEVALLGNAQPLGELSLSAYTGGTAGAISSHILYEVI